MKHCPKCNQDLPIDDFAPSQQTRQNVYCISCQRAYNREYYRANQAKLNATHRAYAEQHRAEILAYQRQYHAQNRDYEQRKAYYRERYQAKREKIRAYQRVYQKQRPGLSARRTMRYYARKIGAEGTHSSADWQALRAWFGDRCLCCGATEKLEADHVIPLDNGGSDNISNIQPLCRTCNASKATQTVDYRDPERLAAFLTSYSAAREPTPPAACKRPAAPPI